MELNDKQKEYLKTLPTFADHMQKQLQDPEYQRMWLEETLAEFLQNGDVNEFIRALTYVVKARGRGEISRLAKDLKIDRSNLSEILNGKKQPHLDTAIKLINGLGYNCNVKLEQKLA